MHFTHFSRRQIIIIGAGVLLVLGAAALFLFGGVKKSPPEVKLAVWGTESETVFKAVVEQYQKVSPNVKVSYTQLPAAGYHQQILEALAMGTGPDVLMLGNRDLALQKNKLLPAPPAAFSLARLRELFPAAVEDDFADQGYVYALPLSLDTLALFYNKDFFDRAAIVAPPATWQNTLDDVAKLRARDAGGGITRAAIALGGSSRSVSFAPDIVQLIMLQNGARLPNMNGGALDFYLQFSDVGSAAYTWHEAMPPSLTAFASGKAAMALGYRSSLAAIRAASPFLRFGIAPAPQISPDSAVSFPRYAGFAVSRQSKTPDWAWDFVVQTATNPSVVGAYLAVSGAPPALRSEIAKLLGDAEFGVFARQALTARSWQAPGEARTAQILDEAIQNVLMGQADSRTALSRAQAQITQLLQAR